MCSTTTSGLQLDASPLTVTELDSRYEPVTPRPFGYLYEGRATSLTHPSGWHDHGSPPDRNSSVRSRRHDQLCCAGMASRAPRPLGRRGAGSGVRPGRHLAPDVPGVVRIAAPEDLTRRGRHVEPE